MKRQLLPLSPARYQRHAIHGEGRIWAETNCYTDVWIELLHAWGFEPTAVLPFTLAIDFEGDQWTFFKPPLADLYDLYGLDVQELALWRPLTNHIEEQLSRGRPVLVELDSYWLPDTAGTAYRVAHTKSTVAVNIIDVAEQYLGYFHNQGYFELHGDDFAHIFRLQGPAHPDVLPPYTEFVTPRRPARTGRDLTDASLRLVRQHLDRLPTANPFEKFKARFETDLPTLASASLDAFHLYSFATLRQFGACYELAATYLDWLARGTGLACAEPIAAFTQLATGAKTLQFHLARAMARKKPLDLTPLDTLAATWSEAMARVRSVVG